jgi:hypothetical protein
VERPVRGYVLGIEKGGEAGERLCTGDREKWRGWWEAMYWETNKPMHQKVLTLNPFIISPAHRILSRSLFPLQGLYRQS